MKYLDNKFLEEIKPFIVSEYNGIFSAILEADMYKSEIIKEYYILKGVEIGGYGWDAITDVFIKEKLSRYENELNHDSESSMFCLYSTNEKAIYDFLKGFKEYCENDNNFRYLLDKADFENWD